jgi:hypothetical protein
MNSNLKGYFFATVYGPGSPGNCFIACQLKESIEIFIKASVKLVFDFVPVVTVKSTDMLQTM